MFSYGRIVLDRKPPDRDGEARGGCGETRFASTRHRYETRGRRPRCHNGTQVIGIFWPESGAAYSGERSSYQTNKEDRKQDVSSAWLYWQAHEGVTKGWFARLFGMPELTSETGRLRSSHSDEHEGTELGEAVFRGSPARCRSPWSACRGTNPPSAVTKSCFLSERPEVLLCNGASSSVRHFRGHCLLIHKGERHTPVKPFRSSEIRTLPKMTRPRSRIILGLYTKWRNAIMQNTMRRSGAPSITSALALIAT